MKKIISFFVAVLLVASMLTFGASAAAQTTLQGTTVNAKAGDTVTVDFVINGNTGFDAANMTVSVASPLEIVGMTKGIMNGGLINEAYWLINHASATPVTADGSLFTVSVKVPAGTAAGTYNVDLTVKYIRASGESLNFEVKSGKVIVSAGETTHTHNHNIFVKTVAPTCKDKGYDIYKCECDDEIRKNEVPATGKHTYTAIAHQDATCGKDGYTTYKCSGCGHIYNETHKATGKHTYIAIAHQDATCGQNGYTTYKCSGCGHTYNETHNATGKHSYKEIARKDAVCGQDGYITYKCSGCGHTYNETIKASGKHSYKEVARVAATCEQNGYITYKCSGCGHTYNETLKATGHNVKEVARKAATCTENGYITYKCLNCGATHNEVLKATGHNFMKDGKYCYGSNATSHWYVCQNCGGTSEAVKHEHDQQHDGYNWCVCGHRGDAIKKPATGGDYDDVPQTGDITGYVTFGAVAMISMAAAAAYVVTRKFAKK